jgi:HSP20 family molecular chaperone IbpA
MGLENLVQWTKNKLSRFTGGDVPVMTSRSLDGLNSGRVGVPAVDLFENEREFQLVVDAPGATPRNAHVTWNEVDIFESLRFAPSFTSIVSLVA